MAFITFRFKSKDYSRRGSGVHIKAKNGILNVDDSTPAGKKLLKYLRTHRENTANKPLGVGKWTEISADAVSGKPGNLLDDLMAMEVEQLTATLQDTQAGVNKTKGELISLILEEKENN